jgi:hypothetical protein
MRRQLDALMGTDRNGEPTIKKNFTDRDVCTSFLCGLCPHELFNNTVYSYIFLFSHSLLNIYELQLGHNKLNNWFTNTTLENGYGRMRQNTFTTLTERI